MLIPASAREYAETRPFERSELREFEDAASITVITVMLNTTVTISAITSAKPRSSVNRVRSRVMSAPRAVAEVDGVGELVRVERRAALQADGEVDDERREALATGYVRERGEDGACRQVVGDLDPLGGRLLTQGAAAWEGAVAATRVCSTAAQRLAPVYGRAGMLASDLHAELPKAMRELLER